MYKDSVVISEKTMGKLDKGFTFGPVVLALVIGGVLFMAYPAAFNGSGYSNGVVTVEHQLPPQASPHPAITLLEQR